MNERMEKLYALLENEELDVAFITLPKMIYYFTGFYSDPHERFMALVCVKGKDPFLFVPILDHEKAARVSQVSCIYSHKDEQNPYEVLKPLLGSGIARMGIQEEYLNVKRYHALMQITDARQAVDLEPHLNPMRVVKSAEEIVTIKRAIHCIEEVIRTTLPLIKPGVTELDIVAEMEFRMKRLGAEGPSFDTMVLAGEKSGLPHGIPGNNPIREGELLLIDAGVFVDGYASDITRTFAVGDIGKQCKEIYEAVLQANLSMIEAVRPGVTFGSLDQAARQAISSRGYGDYFITRAGHGFGLEIHEYPSIHGGNEDLLGAGMVFTAEPGIYMPGVGGVRIEDNVIVTANGVEVLTTFPKELTVIG
ncbi:aminopeptidase P family protein [Paenibacillus sp. SYP-B3998]|uniref:Aminopeptidase P family protein n=1 Tax=Paenibacillus sp. SYP-B3998 TaxID=2678564 RepID=A0A6G3ZZ27_9BACL|nr:Xaa-Pro peptidase family protein [Paenibacillus sp. SYP-B3998]NEW06657.1 aminopeptidase P family protein [Paenibacillus sp. SYP-B3998]